MATDPTKEDLELIPESELDETSILSSLTRLQLMHASLRQLRETVPKVMDSIFIDSRSPDQLHSHFSQTAIGAAKDIKNFAQLTEESKSKEALNKAKESRANDAEGITAWRVSEHADWLDVKKEDAAEDSHMDTNNEELDTSAGDLTVEDMQATLKKFKESHMGIAADLDEDTRTVKIFLPPPANIHFEIQPTAAGEDQSNYSVHSVEKTKLHGKIIEAIASHSTAMGLYSLLEMLVAYKDFKSRPCIKCSRLLDPNAQFPVVRLKRRIKQADGLCLTQWDAFHLSCT